MRGNKYKPLYKIVDELEEKNAKLEAKMEAKMQDWQEEKQGLELKLEQTQKFANKLLAIIGPEKLPEEIRALM